MSRKKMTLSRIPVKTRSKSTEPDNNAPTQENTANVSPTDPTNESPILTDSPGPSNESSAPTDSPVQSKNEEFQSTDSSPITHAANPKSHADPTARPTELACPIPNEILASLSQQPDPQRPPSASTPALAIPLVIQDFDGNPAIPLRFLINGRLCECRPVPLKTDNAPQEVPTADERPTTSEKPSREYMTALELKITQLELQIQQQQRQLQAVATKPPAPPSTLPKDEQNNAPTSQETPAANPTNFFHPVDYPTFSSTSDPRVWLRDFKMAADLNHADDKSRFIRARMSMLGAANAWFNRAPWQDQTWTEFESRFTKSFVNDKDIKKIGSFGVGVRQRQHF